MSHVSPRHSNGSMRSTRPAAIESLEGRTLFAADLVVSVPGTIPVVDYIAGTQTKLKIPLNIANNGDSTAKGKVAIQLWLSQDGTLSSDDLALGTPQAVNLGIKSGKNKTYKIKPKTLPQNANGPYEILGEVTGAFAPAVAASTAVITVLPPFVDLTDQVDKVSKTGHAGKKISVTVSVLNHGNVPITGNLDVAFSASTDPSGTNGFALGTQTKKVKIKPTSKPTVLHLHVPLLAGVSTGNQFITATINPNGTILESNTTGDALLNNASTSGTPVSIT